MPFLLSFDFVYAIITNQKIIPNNNNHLSFEGYESFTKYCCPDTTNLKINNVINPIFIKNPIRKYRIKL